MALIDIDWNPGRGQLRTFGSVGTVVFGAVGAWAWVTGTPLGLALEPQTARVVAYCLGGLASACLLLALLAPRGLRPLFIVLTVLTFPIGFILSYVVMAIVYYGVVTPIAIGFRLAGKDPLERRADPRATSYWVRRKPPAEIERYFRQY